MKIYDFINEFERLLDKTKQYGSYMSSGISVYRLLKAANLSEYHEQLTRATNLERKIFQNKERNRTKNVKIP